MPAFVIGYNRPRSSSFSRLGPVRFGAHPGLAKAEAMGKISASTGLVEPVAKCLVIVSESLSITFV
jgi:hypothetical protein